MACTVCVVMKDAVANKNITPVGQFTEALMSRAVALFGVETVENLVSKKLVQKISSNHENGLYNFDLLDTPDLQKIVSSLIELIENVMGFALCENIIAKIYVDTTTKPNSADANVALLGILPDTYLERERVLHLTRSELEKKVLEKVDELGKTNVSLEETVRNRTKELAEANRLLAERNEELAHINERLITVDKLKSEFVSVAAHQMRTPLSAVKWALQLVLDGDAGEITRSQQELVKKGYANNERMILLVDDLLDVHRIETGKQVLDLSSVAIEEIVTAAIEMMNHSYTEKGLTLQFNHPQKHLPKVSVDVEKIRSIIEGLLDNALKYTEKGSVIVEASRVDKGIELHVQDTGVGIPTKEQGRIFSKFFRASNAVRLSTDGTGLGLFIAKNIMELHGGSIHFMSKIGEGTTFIITFPLRKADVT